MGHLRMKGQCIRPWRCRERSLPSELHSLMGKVKPGFRLPSSLSSKPPYSFSVQTSATPSPVPGCPLSSSQRRWVVHPSLTKWVGTCGGMAWKLKTPPALTSDRDGFECWLAVWPGARLRTSACASVQRACICLPCRVCCEYCVSSCRWETQDLRCYPVLSHNGTYSVLVRPWRV